MSLRWSSYVDPKPPNGGSKRKTAVFRVKSHLKKICYKVFFCKICQRQGCKALIGLIIRAKIIGGGDQHTKFQQNSAVCSWGGPNYAMVLRDECPGRTGPIFARTWNRSSAFLAYFYVSEMLLRFKTRATERRLDFDPCKV